MKPNVGHVIWFPKMILQCFVFEDLQSSLEYALEICHYIQPWQHTPETPALRRLRQRLEFKANLDCIMNAKPAWACETSLKKKGKVGVGRECVRKRGELRRRVRGPERRESEGRETVCEREGGRGRTRVGEGGRKEWVCERKGEAIVDDQLSSEQGWLWWLPCSANLLYCQLGVDHF